MTIEKMRIFSGTANLELGRRIAEYLSVPMANATVRRFADGEIFIQIDENVRGRDVFVVQPTSNPANDHLMELLIMVDALHRASAGRITAVIPYYGYARQDRKEAGRTPITAKLVADLLHASGVKRVLTLDLHAGQIQGFFNMPVDNLYATPVLLAAVRKWGIEDAVVISPDIGGVVRARSYAKRLHVDLAIIDKRRPAPNVAEVHHIIGEVENKHCIIVDDMVDTAGTMIKAAEALLAHGALSVSAVCSHGVLSGVAVQRIQSSVLARLLVTDTIQLSPEALSCPKIEVRSVAPLLGEAIRRICDEESVSSLFV
ncbi:Ribose-phosphate pyrophosphokinase [Candidatus Magnetaquicoccaceae bacterium FCR-1]|uniref:Ribose-phosphate pyrophosphokinase n=1 Tax=Candidatus Magnetaquiglobus chichijimensis TaxID=3141448 RepID=A0ABQ0C850_9PROT